MPYYLVRHVAGQREELPCLIQLEDENAAMYFNIIHGAKHRRRFTTAENGKRCADYLLMARDIKPRGMTAERQIALFELAYLSPARRPDLATHHALPAVAQPPHSAG